MVRNTENREQATVLRARGFTLQEIAQVCDVSKSTVSKWLQGDPVSAQVTADNKRRAGQANAKRLRLVNKARGSERATRYKEILRAAETECKHYKASPLFAAGLMLYAAHGERTDTTKVRFSTHDIASHQVFVRFMMEFMGVERAQLRIWLQLYPAHTEADCMKQWSKALKLPYQQFHRTQFVGSAATQPLHFGVGNTIIGSTVLQRKLLHWVTLMQKELVK